MTHQMKYSTLYITKHSLVVCIWSANELTQITALAIATQLKSCISRNAQADTGQNERDIAHAAAHCGERAPSCPVLIARPCS